MLMTIWKVKVNILCLSEYLRGKRPHYQKGYKNYSEENLDLAVRACLEEKMNFRKAAQFYNVPSHTVYRRARKLRETQ